MSCARREIQRRYTLFAHGLWVVVAVAFGVGCEGRPAAFTRNAASSKRPSAASAPFTDSSKAKTVAVFDLGGGAPEKDSETWFGLAPTNRSFSDLLRVARETEASASVASVLVKFDNTRLGAARALEFGDALARVKQSKKVVCHADGYSNVTLMAAVRGCSDIVVSPAGGVDAVGLGTQVVYFRRLLADQLHVSIDMLQVGKYKGAEEPFTRDGPSPEARQSLETVLADVRQAWLDTIAKGRTLDLGDAKRLPVVEDGPYSPLKAKELGLIDHVGFVQDALNIAKQHDSRMRERVVFGPGASAQGPDLETVIRSFSGESPETGPIALVRAVGAISMTSGGGPFGGGSGGIVESDLDPAIAELERDDDVKAVVLRIDSPGGSALASDLIWNHLMRLRSKKPLVVSVGDMAASGGMYIASAADYIYAEPMSIVGSIGVVGGKFSVGETLEQLGVHVETFPANASRPEARARVAYESPFTRWDAPTRERVLDGMTAVYNLFLSRVSEGRSTRGRDVPVPVVAASAEGRIFGGIEGKKRGLVDEIGGLSEAIAKACELAGLPGDSDVKVVHYSQNWFERIAGGDDVSGRVGGWIRQLVGGSSALGAIGQVTGAAELQPFAESLAPLALQREHAVVALPFALQVK